MPWPHIEPAILFRRTNGALLTLAPALILPIIFLCLGERWQAPVLALAAVAATLFGAATHRLTFAFHGLFCLGAAAFVSGLLPYSARALAGAFPPQPDLAAWIIAATAVCCYALGGQIEETEWQPQLFHALSGTLAVAAAATILITWIASLTNPAGPPQVTLTRTIVACGLGVTLAWLGPRWQRVELTWLACATLAAITVAVGLDSLRHTQTRHLAASIFLCCATLLAVPDIVRRSMAKWQPATHCP